MDGDTLLAKSAGSEEAARPDRPALVAFVADADTDAALREGLAEAVPAGIDMRRGGIRAAVAALRGMPTPRTLIVDVSDEDQLSSLEDLSHVVEPDVRVLVVGDREDVNFYRSLTRGLGVLEYLYKPLSPDMVARHFGPLVTGQATVQEGARGGRVVTVTGARGGAGASTVAAALAWHFGVVAKRHTALLDSDLHRGSCAMLLGHASGTGLRAALEQPQRIDELFVERAAQPVADRLHVLAAEERLTEQPSYAPGAAARLLDALRRRYNFVVADVPFSGLPLHRDLLDLAHQRVLVMQPTLAAVRDTLRLLALPNGPQQPRRAVVVLNRAGLPGGMTRRQIADALKFAPDVMVPDLPKLVGRAATLGEPPAAARGGFRDAIRALAQQVAFVRVLDEPAARAGGWRLFRRAGRA